MELAAFEDIQVSRGKQILEGPAFIHRDVAAAIAEKEEKRGRTPQESASKKSNGGLEMGRRQCIVVKEGSEQMDTDREDAWAPSDSNTRLAPSSGHCVRIVDHGESQKEAIRRLFDAQVLLRSYEQQLSQKEVENTQLNIEVRKVRQLKAKYLSPQGDVRVNRGSDVDEPSAEEKAAVEKAQKATHGHGHDIQADEANGSHNMAKKIPFWLRNDEKSRSFVEMERGNLMRQYMVEGHLDPKMVIDLFWNVGMEFALRWGGHPDDEITKSIEAIEARCRKIQRDALQETSMLRQHLKKLEKKYRELQQMKGGGRGSSSDMKGNQASSAGAAARRSSAGRSGGEGGGGGGGGGGDRNTTNAAGAVAGGFGGHGTPADAAAASRGTSAAGGDVVGAAGSAGVAGAAARARTGTDDRMGGAAGFRPAQVSQFDDAPFGGHRNVTTPGGTALEWSDLHEDETLIVNLEREELEALDTELFEPLNGLDDDLRELAIDVVNEKVRRILTLDPSKFKGGKVPFGIRPDKLDPDTYERLARLEGELEQLQEDHRELREEYEHVKNQLEAARRGVQHLKDQKSTPQRGAPTSPKEPSARSPASVPSPTQSQGGRGRELIVQGSTDDEVNAMVTAAVNDAVQKQSEMMNQQLKAKASQITELDKKLKATEAQLHTSNKKIAEAENKVADALAKLKEAEQRAAKAEADLKKAGKQQKEPEVEFVAKVKKEPKGEPDPVPTKKVKEPPSPASNTTVTTPTAKAPDPVILNDPEAQKKLKAAMDLTAKSEKLLKKSQLSFKSYLKKMHIFSGLKAVGNRDKVDGLIKDVDNASGEQEHDRWNSSIPALEDWGDEIYHTIRSLITKLEQGQTVRVPRHVEPVEAETAPPEEVPQTVTVVGSPEDKKEIGRLRDRVKVQKDEIARLLLTIDEMRARIESVKDVVNESTPQEATVIRSLVKRTGLREIVEVREVPQLKGVFERLYQDAIQRIERLGLIRDRMLVANQAYSHIVNALVSKGEAISPENIPDLDCLSSTAAATLSGMWYHTEFLFRNTCEYAIAQGVESSMSNKQKLSLSEMMEAAQTGDEVSGTGGSDDPNSPDFRARRRAGNRDRLPGRRGGDRTKDYPGTNVGGDTGRAFWHPMPGGIGSEPKSPRLLRRDKLTDPEPSQFSSYITALREARGDLRADEWPRATLPERKVTKGDGIEFCPKTLKASIAGSRSLPVLPKGRGGILQQAHQLPDARSDISSLEASRAM